VSVTSDPSTSTSEKLGTSSKNLAQFDLHGLEDAISSSGLVADALVHEKYAEILTFETQTLEDSSVSDRCRR
jgi:hypothetical protein